MRLFAVLAIALCVMTSASASESDELEWTAGIGLQSCRDLHVLNPDSLFDWMQGYWTGANLCLGGTDLCLERASIAKLDKSQALTALKFHCAEIGDSQIMFAAFNALKGLPSLEGSRAAGCSEEGLK